MNKHSAIALGLAASSTLHAAESDRFIEKVKITSGQTVVVAEGDFEARSIGSFSVRLYDDAPPTDETTFFTAGQIRARDGVIEKVVLADVVGDKQPEIVVIVRSVGTGSYISAHAFAVDKQQLVFCGAVEGLASDAEPIAALRKLNENEK
jgi:hypothetical protein